MKNKSFRFKMYLSFFSLDAIMALLLLAGFLSVRAVSKMDEVKAAKFVTGYGIGILLVVAFLICYMTTVVIFIMRTVRVNITLLKEASIKMAEGDVTSEIEKLNNDEFGELVDEYNIVIKTTREEALVAEAVSNGDLTVTVTPKSEKDTLGNSLKQLVEKNNTALSNISDAAVQVMTSASEVASASEALAQGSTEQASAIEEITASIDDVSDKTKENASKAEDAAELMLNALKNMEKSNESMREMVGAMNDINASSENIQKIIKVIDDIAFQTNILALNAAVEAARAGDAGMGFAVVAEEVRNLAAKSSQAAAETAEMIEESIKRIRHGSEMADETSKNLAEVSNVVSEGEAIVRSIAEASNYQATAIEQIDQAVGQVSQVVATNSATSEECAAASVELSGQANRMRDLLSVYKLGNGGMPSSSYSRSSESHINRNEQIISLSDGFGKY